MNTEKIKEISKTYWKEAIIFILIVGFIVMWQLNQNKNQELAKTKNQIELSKQLSDMKIKMDEIENRDKVVYPKLEDKISVINKNINESKNKLSIIEKNQIKKEKVYETFKAKNVQEISDYFNTNGYVNSTSDNK
jgi:hypothetical protein